MIHPTVSGGENFSLSDFFPSRACDSVEDRIRPFLAYYETEKQSGSVSYQREILSAMGPVVQIKTAEYPQGKEMLMLGSNNYLGFANDPDILSAVTNAMEAYGAGVAGPSLLNGTHALHRKLEREIAKLKGCEDCILFPSGYQANLGWIDGLVHSGDAVLYDAYCHASVIDGLSLKRSRAKITTRKFSHNDCNHLHLLLQELRRGEIRRQIFVCVEGLYSMEGDMAPLPEISSLCKEYGAFLIVDDAHSTGILGDHGGGVCDFFHLTGQIPLLMGSFSKTFALTGGFVASSHNICQYLRYFSRPYLFSAHLPLTSTAAILAGVKKITLQPEMRLQLRQKIAYFCHRMQEVGIKIHSHSPIVPIPIPATINIRKLNCALHDRGLFVNSIEYPAVAQEAQKLRVSLMVHHTYEMLEKAVEIFSDVFRSFGLCQ